MASRPPSRIIATFTIRNAAGRQVTVHRWNTWERAGAQWVDGPPDLKTDSGVRVFDIGQGRYFVGRSDEIFTANE